MKTSFSIWYCRLVYLMKEKRRCDSNKIAIERRREALGSYYYCRLT
jgi:hypothetical protein